MRAAYDDYQFHLVFHALHNFCAVDLSALYLDILKDRLYTFAPESLGRRAAQTALYEILVALTKLMAPILSFTGDEVWERIPGTDRVESVHLTNFPEADAAWLDEALEGEWERLLDVRREVAKALEMARQQTGIGSSLEARVTLEAAPELTALLRGKEPELAPLFIVSQVALGVASGDGLVRHRSDTLGVTVVVDRARGAKCERCWTYRETVGTDPAYPTLCDRCTAVLGFAAAP